MNNLFNLVVRLLLVGVLLAGGYSVAQYWWRNSRTIRQSQAEVIEALNRQLRALKVDEFSSIDFPEASRVLGVPQELAFEQYVYQTTELLGHRPVGKTKGTFDRATGTLEVEIDFAEGRSRDTRLRLQLRPVP